MHALDLSVARWRKSSRSSDTNTCVEVALAGSAAALRDSKHTDGPVLTFPATALTNLLTTIR
jgi:hypothetical protein